MCGGVLGGINGLLVGVKCRPSLPPLPRCSSTSSLAQYLCQRLPVEAIGGGSSVYRMSNQLAGYQPLRHQFGNGKLATLPIVGIVLIAVHCTVCVFDQLHKVRQKNLCGGLNQKAALLGGIKVSLMKTLVFVIAGVLTG